jgi:ketosteroid isomerase-like protein
LDAVSGTDAETIREGIAALNRGDAAGIAAVLDADVELVPLKAAVDGSVYHGHEGMRRWLADMAEDWDEYGLILEDVEEVGPRRLLVRAKVSMRSRASGVAIDSPAAWLCDLRAGKVTRIEFFADAQAARAAAAAG